ncbi:MAG TPA: hypothetical protein VMT52_08310 [Planctomycetota bacterium]|nr:hypothetical protein [Planctomycetota bacterium]
MRSLRFVKTGSLLLLLVPSLIARAMDGGSSTNLEEPKPPGAGTRLLAAGDGPGFDAAALEGPDPKVAELAAHRLLQAIATGAPELEGARLTHLNYLLKKLNVADVPPGDAGAADAFRHAERIVDAIATWTSTSEPPFPRVAEVLLPLLGKGPASFRQAVVRAHRSLVLHELKKSHSSPVLASLAGRFSQSEPAPRATIEDASTILWDTDPKALIGALVGAFVTHASAAPGTPQAQYLADCHSELQARIHIDFSSAEGWQKWWNEVKGLSLEKILADCQRRSIQEYVVSWRQLHRRLRETEDAEKLLLGIQDTLDTSFLLELRVAAVFALGDFAEWVADVRLEGAAAVAKKPNGELTPASSAAAPAPLESSEAARDRLLARGARTLLGLFERRGFSLERPEVLRAALVALGKYHAFLERSPAILGEVSRIVVKKLEGLIQNHPDPNPAKLDALIETLRLAGALRVTDAQGFAESVLRSGSPSSEKDVELFMTAAATLGRLAGRRLTRETATLLMDLSKKPFTGSEKALRDLRRALITALGAGAENADLHAGLRVFYKDLLLGGGDKDLRIPLILGLGTLARQKDIGSLDVLIAVLARQDAFEPQEVIAAVDSIAYVGGASALGSFLEALAAAKDKTVSEHLSKKVLALIEAGGGPVLVWTLEKLHALALEADSIAYLEYAVALSSEPQVKSLLSSDTLDLGSESGVESAWKATFALLRAEDLLGKEDEAASLLASLTDLLLKVPNFKEKFPAHATAHSLFKTALTQRQALRAKLAKAVPADVLSILKDFDALLATEPGIAGRWGNLRWILRQVLSSEPSESLDRLLELWPAAMASESSSRFWEGFPPKCRERCLATMQALRAEKQAR